MNSIVVDEIGLKQIILPPFRMTNPVGDEFRHSSGFMNRQELSRSLHGGERSRVCWRWNRWRKKAASFAVRRNQEVILPGIGRRAYSVIYSLLTPEGFSAMHRLKTG